MRKSWLRRLLLPVLATGLLVSCNALPDVIGGTPEITLSRTSLNLGTAVVGEANSGFFTIRNTGTGDAVLDIEADTPFQPDAPWLTVSPARATVPAGTAVEVDVQAACTPAIAFGAATGTITVTGTGTSVELPVTFECLAQPLTMPQPNPVVISAPVGATAQGSFSFTNAGSTTVDFVIEDEVAWLDYAPRIGTVAPGGTQTVTVYSDCTATVTQSTVAVIEYAGGPRAFTVERTCGLEAIAVTPATSFLSADAGNVTSSELLLQNESNVSTPFELDSLPTWLNATPASGDIPANGSVAITLSTICPSTRTVEAGALAVTSPAGTVPLEVFRVCATPPAHEYDIDIRFFGEGFDLPTIDVFLDAAVKWESVITADLADVPGITTATGECSGPGFPNEPALDDESVDDLLIYAGVTEIDGEFGIVGSAGPCIVRPGTSPDALLPAYGTAFFDSADAQLLLNDNRLGVVVLHEMGHVLGLGTMWENFGLLEYEPEGSDCRLVSDFTSGPRYTGPQGVAAYEQLTGTAQTAVPLEEEGGAGTRCGHWDEEVFRTELMTGFIDNADDPLSRLTGESLLDMGYATDPTAYDPYSLPLCSPFCATVDDPHAAEIHDVLLLPRYEIGPDGTLTPIGRGRN